MICELILALVLDSSGSIKTEHWQTLHEGHAAAFLDPAVQRAIRMREGVAVRVYEFSDLARPMIPWRVVRTQEDAQHLSAEIASAERRLWGSTATGEALAYVLEDIATAPCPEADVVIDVATDGPQNVGRPVEPERQKAEQSGIRINVLAITTEEGDPLPFARDVLATRDGFVMHVTSWEDVPRAVIRKITLELAENK